MIFFLIESVKNEFSIAKNPLRMRIGTGGKTTINPNCLIMQAVIIP